ncbi:MAG: peptidoglycan DD-metalloendopeptidase family protein [Patescibacteria group bacterium]
MFSPIRSHVFFTTLIIALAIGTGIISSKYESVGADTASDLQAKIDKRNSDIQNLEKEIAEYQKQLTTIGGQVSSLASTIKSLELTQKKLEADIAVSENKIAAKNLEIQQLSGQIVEKEETIVDDRRIITQSFATLDRIDNQSVPELLLANSSFSDTWNQLDNLGALQGKLRQRITSLQEVKTGLEINKKATEKAKGELVTLQNQLNDQRKVTIATASEKNALLKETKQSESSYKKLLADKKALKESFEKEILDYESQLRLAVDPSKLPKAGKGVLSWPTADPVITQYFGNTEFATANAQIYNGKGHTGLDLKASIGTPIMAAASGVVVGVANTDIVRSCYSYGKWIMVKHSNGLSTLYAHLSVQSVTTGQVVSRGEVIGYSGNTGYTTGPHLHFGVYATEGVQIKTFDSSINCKGVLIPLADFKAYLNPLTYL